MKENGNLKILTNKFNSSPARNELKKSLTNLFDDENASNSGSLSDIEEIQIDYSKLNSVKLYTDRHLPYIMKHFTEAEVAVEEIIMKIKKEATFLLIENHILSKLPAHSSVLCIEMVDLMINMVENSNCIQENERIKASNYSEDEEPVRILSIINKKLQ